MRTYVQYQHSGKTVTELNSESGVFDIFIFDNPPFNIDILDSSSVQKVGRISIELATLYSDGNT